MAVGHIFQTVYERERERGGEGVGSEIERYREIVIQHQRCVLIYSMWRYKGFHYK